MTPDRNRDYERSPRVESWTVGTLLVLIALLPWPWGGNHDVVRPVFGFTVGLLMAICALSFLVRPRGSQFLSAAARWPLFFWALWIIWIGLQILPLPAQWLSSLSPRSLEYHDAIRGVHARPWNSVSIAPGQSFNALLDTLALFFLYCLTLALAQSRQRIQLFLLVVFVSGLAQALYGIHMVVTGMEYGFLEKKVFGIGSATGTFVNRNHFAGYLALSAAAGIGLILSEEGHWRFGGWRNFFSGLINVLFSSKFRSRILLVFLVVGVVMSRSRMGNLALFSALGFTFLIYLLLRHRTGWVSALVLLTSLAVVDLWIVSQYFGLDKVVQRVEETDIEREQRPLVLQDLIPAMEDYARTGSGLGTFAQAYSPYRSLEVRSFNDHAHNEYAQIVVETGLPGLGLLALLVGVHILHAMRILLFRRRLVYAGAAFAMLMATCAVLIHASVEFALRMPAVAANWIVLLAVVAAIPAHSSSRRKPLTTENAVTFPA